MFLLVRDEDTETVAEAVASFAIEEGLETVDADNPLAALSLIGAPRVTVADAGGQILILGLASLDIAEPEEWAEALSRGCNAEVVAVDPSEDGLRVHVFDDGERDEEIHVPLAAAGRTSTAALADLSDDDEGRHALTRGIEAADVEALLDAVLLALGARPEAIEGPTSRSLWFRDPLDEEDDTDEPSDPSLVVASLPAARIEGRLGRAVTSIAGPAFTVTLAGIPSLEGLRLELSGDAVDLASFDAVEVAVRRRDAHELELRTVPRDVGISGVSFSLRDAFLEAIPKATPHLDPTDLFSSMQSLVSASGTAMLNTLTVRPIGVGLRAGEASLHLRVEGSGVFGGDAEVPVRVLG